MRMVSSPPGDRAAGAGGGISRLSSTGSAFGFAATSDGTEVGSVLTSV